MAIVFLGEFVGHKKSLSCIPKGLISISVASWHGRNLSFEEDYKAFDFLSSILFCQHKIRKPGFRSSTHTLFPGFYSPLLKLSWQKILLYSCPSDFNGSYYTVTKAWKHTLSELESKAQMQNLYSKGTYCAKDSKPRSSKYADDFQRRRIFIDGSIQLPVVTLALPLGCNSWAHARICWYFQANTGVDCLPRCINREREIWK